MSERAKGFWWGVALNVSVMMICFWAIYHEPKQAEQAFTGKPVANDTCTLPGVTPDMTCTKTKDGCSCKLSDEAFNKRQLRRACQYKLAGVKLLPDVEKDLKAHPEACEGEGYSGEWSAAECLSLMGRRNNNCPEGSSLACSSAGPRCFVFKTGAKK